MIADMNFIQLEYFKKVAECSNISLAAKKLFVSQPAVSKQLKLLESELECKLFIRRRNKLVLTFEGETLLQHARSIIAQVGHIKDELNSKKNKLSGKIVVGCGALTAKSILPDVVELIVKDYPGIEISIFETDWNEISELLENDIIDIGVGPEVNNKRKSIKFKEIFTTNLVFICSKKSELAKKKRIDRKDIRTFPLITYAPNVNIYKCLEHEGFLDGAKIILNTRITETIITYVRKNIGVGIIPRYIIDFEPEKDVLVKDLDTDIKLKIGINFDGSKPLSPAAKLFIQLLSSKYGK